MNKPTEKALALAKDLPMLVEGDSRATTVLKWYQHITNQPEKVDPATAKEAMIISAHRRGKAIAVGLLRAIDENLRYDADFSRLVSDATSAQKGRKPTAGIIGRYLHNRAHIKSGLTPEEQAKRNRQVTPYIPAGFEGVVLVWINQGTFIGVCHKEPGDHKEGEPMVGDMERARVDAAVYAGKLGLPMGKDGPLKPAVDDVPQVLAPETKPASKKK